MARRSGLFLSLTLALLSVGAMSQVLTDSVITFEIFLPDMAITYREGLNSTTSQDYIDMVTKAKSYFSPAGGNSESVIISDGGGCVKIYIAWRNGNETLFAQIMEKLQKDGFMMWNQTWMISRVGCIDEITKVSFTFYVVNFTWSENFKNQNSNEYKALLQDIKNTFAYLNGNVSALELAQNFGCVKFYLEYYIADVTAIIGSISTLISNGITLSGKKYSVQDKECPAPPDQSTLLKFKFYAVNMKWNENFKNHSSVEYQQLLQDVKLVYSPLGGKINTMEIAQNFQCLEFYLEWYAINVMSIMDVTNSMNANGITLMGQKYTTQSVACSAPIETTVIKFTFYVVNMTWLQAYTDKNSSEFIQIKSAIQNMFSSLGGSLRALEVAQNSGCLQVFVEWDIQGDTNIMGVFPTLMTNGLTFKNQTYAVQDIPCAMTPETTVIKFTFYVVNMTWLQAYTDKNSNDFIQIKSAVQNMFALLGGSLRALEVAQNYGCLQVYVEWDIQGDTNIMSVFPTLMTNGLTFKNQTYAVQDKPCAMPPADINECPKLPAGTIGICIDGCNDTDPVRKCQDGFKCCSNGCGRTCQRIGYSVKFNAVITIDMNLVGNVDQTSTAFTELKNAVDVMIKRSFNVEISSLVAGTELTMINTNTVNGKNISALDVSFYLAIDVANEDLLPGKRRLMQDGYAITNGNFRVIDVRLGSSSTNAKQTCGTTDCYGICKETPTRMQSCSCDDGYTGSDCARFDCRSGTTNSLCQNGGECVMKQKGPDFECRCNANFSGPLCKVPLNSCPAVLARRSGLIGLCQSTCVSGGCQNEQMCCKIPCGSNACVEVGYFQKVKLTAVVDYNFRDWLNGSNTEMEQNLKTHLESWLTTKLTQNNVKGFSSAKVLNITSISSTQGTRRKRAESNNAFLFELNFLNEIPAQDLISLKQQLVTEGYNDGSFSMPISSVTLGTQGDCPFMACAGDSFCVSQFGGEAKCACPESRTGQLCDVKNCMPHGTDLCKNGGTCDVSSEDSQMICTCPKGYSGELCEELTDVCALGLCINGGTCNNLGSGKHWCDCPKGFSGSVCQDADTHCREGQPLMTPTGEYGCYRKPCPVGFMCNVDPLDRWTACCFNKGFLCDFKPCQNGGNCVSDFTSGSVCQCPKGFKGLFCEQASNDVSVLTTCQTKQLFNNWLISTLQAKPSTVNISIDELQVILQHQNLTYIPKDICNEQGNFKSMATGVYAANTTIESDMMCLDKFGNADPDCADAICQVLSSNGSQSFCLNGGKCVGLLTQLLCDCTSIGYHGVRCELKGEAVDETKCTSRRDVANLALQILNGTDNVIPGLNKEWVQSATKEILRIYGTNNIFVPYCDVNGRYEYRGCLYMTADLSKKSCYCALESGELRVGSTVSQFEPPPNCIEDQCPESWGPKCEKPNWWCSTLFQCKPGKERCEFFSHCSNEEDFCTRELEQRCVALGTTLPCDLQPCKDDPFSMCQPCGTQATCYNMDNLDRTTNSNYYCECNPGFSGKDCMINEKVCSMIPANLCESGCIGDVQHGQLCQCEPGYGGIFCNKPARSECERRKALYDDALSIMNGKISMWKGYTSTELKSLVRQVVNDAGADQIPVLSCTSNGFYDKVQCMVSINSLDNKNCYCVDYNGYPISSNVQPYIGYDVCTAPTDSREFAQTACNTAKYLGADGLTICLNGGTCVFEMYGGQYCSCPAGFYGQFCQYQGSPSGSKSKSLCNFYADLWNVANEISMEHATWITNDVQKQFYLSLSLNFLQLQVNSSLALKTECKDDGTFKPAACYYNVTSGEKGSCYCWNLRGLIVEGMAVDSADTDKCPKDQRDSTCPLMKCYYICQHGYRKDYTGCQTCDCKNPCQDMSCDVGQRCVIQNVDTCEKDPRQMTCTEAVCMSVNKPGACPGNTPQLSGKGNSSSCGEANCYDDSDCKGQQKCCGSCGKICTDLEVSAASDCLSRQMKAMLAKNMKTGPNADVCDTTNIPQCQENGMWASQQCQSSLGVCWCVTPEGNYINNTIQRGAANCNEISQASIMAANKNPIDITQINYPVCDKGQDLYCCPEYLCAQQCLAYPNAMCTINACGGCKAEFYSNNKLVDCDKGQSSCKKDINQVYTATLQKKINQALAKGVNVNNLLDSKRITMSNTTDTTSVQTKSLNSDYPPRCQLAPATGSCKGYQPMFYFDPASQTCKVFIWGMCEGNDNRFDTPEECYATCSPQSNPCLKANCSDNNTMCKLMYDEDCSMNCKISPVCAVKQPQTNMVKGMFMPTCTVTGQYDYKQCLGDYCWCVNSNGQYSNGLTIDQATSLICSENGTNQTITSVAGMCSNGKPNIACMKACASKVCPGQPDATCVVDICSENCKTMFVDMDGKEVTCSGDICKTFTFDKPAQCNYTAMCPGTSVKTCPESVCDMAMKNSCNKNLCAVCKVKPCTCEPYFVDVITGTQLMVDQCKYVSNGMCKVKKCTMYKSNEQAKYQNMNSSIVVSSFPDCEDNGIFKPMQCQGESCTCVNQYGMDVAKKTDGVSCKKIDKIKIVKITFTYQADFATFKKNNKLKLLVDLLLKKLTDVGINPKIIKGNSEPYEGSIKVDVTFKDDVDVSGIDLAEILSQLEESGKTGDLNLNVNGQVVPMINMTEDIKTESQVEEDVNKSGTKSAGLTETEKIIIGVVCGCVGLLIIAIITYCLCCRNRKKKEPLDDSFETTREISTPFGKPVLSYYDPSYQPPGDIYFNKVVL